MAAPARSRASRDLRGRPTPRPRSGEWNAQAGLDAGDWPGQVAAVQGDSDRCPTSRGRSRGWCRAPLVAGNGRLGGPCIVAAAVLQPEPAPLRGLGHPRAQSRYLPRCPDQADRASDGRDARVLFGVVLRGHALLAAALSSAAAPPSSCSVLLRTRTSPTGPVGEVRVLTFSA